MKRDSHTEHRLQIAIGALQSIMRCQTNLSMLGKCLYAVYYADIMMEVLKKTREEVESDCVSGKGKITDEDDDV